MQVSLTFIILFTVGEDCLQTIDFSLKPPVWWYTAPVDACFQYRSFSAYFSGQRDNWSDGSSIQNRCISVFFGHDEFTWPAAYLYFSAKDTPLGKVKVRQVSSVKFFLKVLIICPTSAGVVFQPHVFHASATSNASLARNTPVISSYRHPNHGEHV